MSPRKVTRREGLHPFHQFLVDSTWGYARWQKEEGIPVVTGFHIEDVHDLPLEPWERTGGRGTFINLANQSVDDAYLCEIAPSESLRPQRHLFEEVVYVVEGRGTTSLRQGDGPAVQFEWQKGSLFTIPLNAEYVHSNIDGRNPALLLGCTSAPLMIDLFRNRDFIFNNPFRFEDRFAGTSEELSGEGTLHSEYEGGVWETNFVPDVREIALQSVARRGKGLKHMYIALAKNVMKIHLAEFAVGTYKKAHAHGPGAHILILEGEGYSLMWPDGEEPKRYDWRPGSLFSPPGGWYHQHFNTGDRPVFHLAFHRPVTVGSEGAATQIEYEDEDPGIRELFNSELAKNGVRSLMEV
jgi:quercetin dioxygenase-like cupin family protein